MKITKLIIAIATLPLVGACTTVREDPRSQTSGGSLYRNTDSASGGTGGSSSRSRVTGVSVSEPQPESIRVKPGTQPARYLNTTSPYDAPRDTTPSPYDRSSGGSPLRHDTPDKPNYQR